MLKAEAAPLIAVKSKEGELEALTNTSEINGHVRIMVELIGNLAPAGGNAKKVVDAAVQAALSGNPLWIDTTWLTSDTPFGGSVHEVLEQLDHDIEDNLNERLHEFDGPCLIPVVPAQADLKELHPARMLLEHQHRPVVIRARNVAAGRDLADAIEYVATVLRLAPEDLHVVLDEAYTPAVHEHHVDALAHRIDGLSGLNCASMTVLAGSTPLKRANFETRTRPRPEVLLRDAVQRYSRRALAYGDYGVVHPIPHLSKGAARSPNPYIHYTVPGETLSIARRIPNRVNGAPPRGASEHYFREVADELVGRSEFAGPKFSWGDRVLDSCMSTPITPIGRSTKWIALATSHHVVHLARRLDNERPETTHEGGTTPSR
ncbi:hypothetical protein IQ251_18390 [Saccharopolyspora sp. HNM0983]|uniref:T4 beta protein n=1 Tax=Saccharopolyspora montiporae TaxID=2781240 RepID=A0A929BCU4_9PSEU|nr:hypothetical protein [Saccharopolyspora sp. HNM0983]MBE9376425.1 hypothetical protein [Saccharopolyspora sp. HNM0983]